MPRPALLLHTAEVHVATFDALRAEIAPGLALRPRGAARHIGRLKPLGQGHVGGQFNACEALQLRLGLRGDVVVLERPIKPTWAIRPRDCRIAVRRA